MHFMLLEHHLSAAPGRYRSGPVYVRDEDTGPTVYEAPASDQVAELVEALVRELGSLQDDAMVAAAMAHLNLVMIHPFRDGNGRMARALQTLVLARNDVVEPTFSSVEEWLGRNAEDYHRILALTGGGAWHPGHDAHQWVKFSLRAHDMQAQTVARRVAEAESTWRALGTLSRDRRLPERASDALYDAVLGLRVRRPGYARRAGIEERTATRDLGRLVEEGLLTPVGPTRGRHYLAGPELLELRSGLRSARRQLTDPYPWFLTELRARAPQPASAATGRG